MFAVRKTLGILVNLLALAGLLVTGVLATRQIDQRPRTDDAYLQADLVHMASDEARLALTADQVAAQTSKTDAAASGINTAEAPGSITRPILSPLRSARSSSPSSSPGSCWIIAKFNANMMPMRP
jgi:hypothetical protein